ncbi:MAG: 16S rRNA (cytidine(1402)-2'-O)-methyltransferase [Bacillota bacterium]
MASIKNPGILYLVGTPIGNLEDITLRAIRILKEADLIAAEDTRHTLRLLNHLGISKPLVSFHKNNWRSRIERLLTVLRKGKSVALVTDAGMPGISDPGAEMVPAAKKAGIVVVPVPGPSAVITAVAASGFPAERFAFLGFLPRSGKERAGFLNEIAVAGHTVVFFEAPQRIIKTLEDLGKVCGGRRIALARELTKIHEEFQTGYAEELLAAYQGRKPRGEFTVLVEGRAKDKSPGGARGESLGKVENLVRQGVKIADAVKRVARDDRTDRRDLYREAVKRLLNR